MRVRTMATSLYLERQLGDALRPMPGPLHRSSGSPTRTVPTVLPASRLQSGASEVRRSQLPLTLFPWGFVGRAARSETPSSTETLALAWLAYMRRCRRP